MFVSNLFLAVVPLVPSLLIFLNIPASDVKLKLFKAVGVGIGGFLTTSYLIPIISEYTKKKGLSGKDLCKKGLSSEEKDM
jgi:hypothetical protein